MISFELTGLQREWLTTSYEDAKVLRKYSLVSAQQGRIHPVVMGLLQERYFTLPIEVQDPIVQNIVLAELAKGDAAAALVLAMHWFAIREAQRPEVDEPMRDLVFEAARNGLIAAAISEAKSTGHDETSFTPGETAIFSSDGSVTFTGDKTTVTGSSQCKHFVVYAERVNPDGTRSGKTVCLLIPNEEPSVKVNTAWDSRAKLLEGTNSNGVKFINAPAVPIFETDQFLMGAIFQYGPSTFGYAVAYLGVLEELLVLARALSPAPSEKARCDFAMFAAETMAARRMMDYMLWCYSNQLEVTPLTMLQLKYLIAAAAKRVWELDLQVGGRGLLTDRYWYLTAALRAAGLMPPNVDTALRIMGDHLMQNGLPDAYPELTQG